MHLLRLGQQEAAARVDLRPLDHLAALILLAEQRRVDDVCAVARHDSRDRRGSLRGPRPPEARRSGRVQGALKRAGERRAAARLAAKTAKARETSERGEAARQAVARAAVAQEAALAEREWRAVENRADILGATVRRAEEAEARRMLAADRRVTAPPPSDAEAVAGLVRATTCKEQPWFQTSARRRHRRGCDCPGTV